MCVMSIANRDTSLYNNYQNNVTDNEEQCFYNDVIIVKHDFNVCHMA